MFTRMSSLSRLLTLIPAVLLLAACGSGGDDHTPTVGDPNEPAVPAGPTIGSVTVQTSSPQIGSDGSAAAEITAYVRGANNQFMEGVDVAFSSTSGGLAVTQATTDEGGIAKATLNPAGDPTNRTITVTAKAGDQSGTVSVDVSGTQLTLSGPATLSQNDEGNYTVSLLDSGGKGIPGREIELSSALGNTLSATSVTTNPTGQATFTLNGANGGEDTITASGLGLSTAHATVINVDEFAFLAPTADAEIPLKTSRPVTVRWTKEGVAQPGQTIKFASTRGTLSAGTATTNASGEATVTIQSSNAGFGVLSATTSGSEAITTQRNIEFVATAPDVIDVQASPFTIATAESSAITAVVRDAEGNLVKNQTVVFSLSDVTGGQLSLASARTDSQGRAKTTYTASSTTSAANGVQITATVQGTPISDSVALTVGRREVFISLGTGNEIEEPSVAQYSMTYAVQVTDSSGNGVPNTPLTLEILSLDYRKGVRVAGPDGWTTPSNIVCPDEDLDRDGILDDGEDLNTSGRIEAGNVATVTPRNVTTDANGFALVEVVYPQEYAYWVNVRLSATTAVQGSEFARSVTFLLPGLADDFNDAQKAPPGPVSPFGTQACNSPD